jgi:predicted DCC family thiol-disulfide oxidoreductase YuxK
MVTFRGSTGSVSLVPPPPRGAGPATLIYDGSCRFCRRWVERIRRWDHHRWLSYLPYQSHELEVRFPHLSREACAARIHLIDTGGRVFAGAAAGREVLRRLPGGAAWTLPFRVPGGLWAAERIYVWITHRWGPLGRRPR